jgi:hypothetical protein
MTVARDRSGFFSVGSSKYEMLEIKHLEFVVWKYEHHKNPRLQRLLQSEESAIGLIALNWLSRATSIVK